MAKRPRRKYVAKGPGASTAAVSPVVHNAPGPTSEQVQPRPRRQRPDRLPSQQDFQDALARSEHIHQSIHAPYTIHVLRKQLSQYIAFALEPHSNPSPVEIEGLSELRQRCGCGPGSEGGQH